MKFLDVLRSEGARLRRVALVQTIKTTLSIDPVWYYIYILMSEFMNAMVRAPIRKTILDNVYS